MKLDTSHTVYKQADAAASQPQLVLMLCDAVIRYLKEAASHLQNDRWAEKGQAVDAAYECLRELRCRLDLERGGEMASNLDRMYSFLGTKLTLANADRDMEQFQQIIRSVESLRDAWCELFGRLRVEGKIQEIQ